MAETDSFYGGTFPELEELKQWHSLNFICPESLQINFRSACGIPDVKKPHTHIVIYKETNLQRILYSFLKWDLLGELSIVIGRAAMSKKLQISHNHWRNGTALSRLQLSLEQDGQVPGSGGKQ